MPTAAIIGTSVLSSALQSRNAKKGAKSAANAELEGQRMALEATQQAAEQARSDAIPLFSSGQNNVLQGYRAANELAGQSIPEQIRAFQSGNMGAQNALLQGLPQMQNAILGGPINNNALQAQRINAPNDSFFQRDLPQFQTIEDALAPPEPVPPVTVGGSGGFTGGLGGFGNLSGYNANDFQNPNFNNLGQFRGGMGQMGGMGSGGFLGGRGPLQNNQGVSGMLGMNTNSQDIFGDAKNRGY